MEIQRWKEYEQLLLELAEKNGIPMHATFELTPLCNFDCKMCYVHLAKAEQCAISSVKQPEEWLQLAEKCREAGVLSITLTGGEVFAYPGFIELYEKIYDMGFLVNILSNGYLINDDTTARLKSRKPHKMRVTLYGASDVTYKKVCGIENGYERVTKNVLALKDAGINIAVSMTVISDNQHDLPKITEWARENGLGFISTCRIHLPQRGAATDCKGVRIVADDFAADLDLSELQESEYVSRHKENAFCTCKCHNNSFVATWEGKMQGCLSIVSITEDAFSDDLISSFRSLWHRLDAIKLPEKCHNCKLLDFCMMCPGTIAAESGNPEVVYPYICAMARWNYLRWKDRNVAKVDAAEDCEL